ncbi:MAG: ribonuclease PH [Betaproteobacteria bacterium]
MAASDAPSASGRGDGRAADALRPTRFTWDPMGFALSSVTVHTGRTAVICSVCLEEGVPRWRQGSGQGWLSADYRLLPASTPSRQPRELMKLSGRTQEIQRLIARSLRACLDLGALGERSLQVDCDVLQADAGTRTAAITGAFVAAHDAVARLVARGVLGASPIRDHVAAVSVGIVQGVPLLDLEYTEDSSCDTDMNVVMTGSGHFVEVQGTAEGAAFGRHEMNALLDLASAGIAELVRAQRAALGLPV